MVSDDGHHDTVPGQSDPRPQTPSVVDTQAAEDTQAADDFEGGPSRARYGQGLESRLRTAGEVKALGRYTVLDELGRGGVGIVFRAYDPKLDRKVAVKILDRGIDEKQTKRLLREAQAMAKLSHPNVVQVYEVGECDGLSFVAMELVEGQTLEQWMKQQPRPGWRACVELFVQLGAGLAAAHEQGLVHRDFKPSNAIIDDKGRARVLDFGLARRAADSTGGGDDDTDDDPAMAQQAWTHEHQTVPLDLSLTKTGAVMGTPAYMSPEQWKGQEADDRSDQFSFCVALYEALYDQRPFEGNTMMESMASTMSGDVRPSPKGSNVPAKLRTMLLEGLSVEPAERWPSMEALLQALSWDPRQRRNRWLLGLTAVTVLGLGGAAVQAWAERRAHRCEGARARLAGIWDEDRRAEVEAAVLAVDRPYSPDVWSRTEPELDEYADAWVAMHTEACEATAVRAEQSARMLDLRMGCLHRASVELEATVDTLSAADTGVVDQAHELVARLRPLHRCADTEALEADVEPPLPHEAEAVDKARQRLARSRSERAAGRPAAAQAEVEAAARLLEGVEYGPVHARRALEEGNVLEELGKYDAAEAVLIEALERATREDLRNEVGDAARQLMVVVGYRQQRMDEGLRYWPFVQGLSAADPERDAQARQEHGGVLHAQGKYEEAEAEFRAATSLREKALGPEHPDLAESRNSLGAALFAQGKYEQAEAEFRAALSLREKALGPQHPKVANSLDSLGTILYAQGKYEQAEAELRAALSLRAKTLGPQHPEIADLRSNLGSILKSQGKYEEAEAELRAALSLRAKTLGPQHPEIANLRNNLGSILKSQGKYVEAEAELRTALSLREKALGPQHPKVANLRNNLGSILKSQGRYEEAEAEIRTALSLREKALGPEHPKVALTRSELASLLLTVGHIGEALTLAEKAWTRDQRKDTIPQQRARTAFVLAKALWSINSPARDRARARDLAEDAVASYRAARGEQADALAAVEQWLDRHRLE